MSREVLISPLNPWISWQHACESDRDLHYYKSGSILIKSCIATHTASMLQEGGSYAGALGTETALRCTECPSEPSNPTGQMTRTMAPMPI